jgi:hypothetical protein
MLLKLRVTGCELRVGVRISLNLNPNPNPQLATWMSKNALHTLIRSDELARAQTEATVDDQI